MATKANDVEAQTQSDQQKHPLLGSPPTTNPDRQSLIQQAISQTFESTAHLAKLLPTGTVLAFQLLAPIFTNGGRCSDTDRYMTAILVVICGLSCLVLSFSDSFRDPAGKVRYGLATFRGLWVIDGSTGPPPEKAANYRIKFIDFMHAFLSVAVFMAIALFDKNAVSCFYPIPSEPAQRVLTALPVGIGVFSCMLFVLFPTTRHGIGFPLTAHTAPFASSNNGIPDQPNNFR